MRIGMIGAGQVAQAVARRRILASPPICSLPLSRRYLLA
jgi:hypothetical protein